MKSRGLFLMLGAVVMLMLCFMATYADLSQVECRKEGIWLVEEKLYDAEVMDIDTVSHKISVYSKDLNKLIEVKYSGEVTLEVDDAVEIKHEVWYLKPGFRIFTKDFVLEVADAAT